jgi:hypothetical protein
VVNGQNSGNDVPLASASPSAWRTIKRLAWESAIPLAIAGVYVWWDSSYGTGFPFAEKIKIFGVAFFLLMWFVGQYLRVRKQLQDRDLLLGLGADVQAIRTALAQSAAAHGEAAPASPENVPIADPVAQEMMEQAEEALSSSLTLPALLMAMAAFEHSVRTAARRLGVEEGRKVPVRRTLTEVGRHLPTGVAGELRALWDARNNLVHSRDAQVQWSKDAQQLFNSLRWAVALLSKAGPGEWDRVPLAA